MVQIAGKKDNNIKQLVHVDDDGNLILSSDSVIDIDEVTTVASVTSVTTVGTITNAVTVTGTVAVSSVGGTVASTQSGTWTVAATQSGTWSVTQSGTWNIGTVSTVSSVTDVVNVQDVDSVNLVDKITAVDEVSKCILYGTDLQAVERPLECNDEGVLSTARLQLGDVVDSGYVTFPATAPQYSQRFVDISEPTDETYDKYMLYIVNATADDIVVQVLNEFTSGLGITEYGLVGDEITVDAANITSPSAVAWSSCFTSINAALTDESGDWNDDVPPGGADVPFAFAATNDAIYFGHSAPFKVIYARVITAGSYVATFTWEYWDGDSWETLDVNATSGTGEEPFKSTGVTLYYWATPQDWVAYDIDGDPTSQYWIRARCTAYTSRAVTPSLGQGAYLLSKDYDAQMHIIEGMFNGGNARIKFYMPNVGTSPATNYHSYTLKKY